MWIFIYFYATLMYGGYYILYNVLVRSMHDDLGEAWRFWTHGKKISVAHVHFPPTLNKPSIALASTYPLGMIPSIYHGLYHKALRL